MDRYIDVTDTTYKGLDIAVFEMEDGFFNVDIKKPCGEVIHSITDIDHWEEADMWALGFVDGYLIAERLRKAA